MKLFSAKPDMIRNAVHTRSGIPLWFVGAKKGGNREDSFLMLPLKLLLGTHTQPVCVSVCDCAYVARPSSRCGCTILANKINPLHSAFIINQKNYIIYFCWKNI